MIIFGLIIAIYAYVIFLIGVIGLLYQPVILGVTILYAVGVSVYLRRRRLFPSRQSHQRVTASEKLLLLLLFIQGLVALLGVLGPEIGFDALWYHLTLPKLYLQNHLISHIPGGLLYYSDMPKLTELLYTAGLAFGDERIPKLIHFLFGIGTCVVLYRFSRRYMERHMALLAVLLFSSNLVVGWEAVSAYIDLSRAFFELLAFVVFMTWIETGKKSRFYVSAIFVGLAISTKVLAFSSLPIYLLLILLLSLQRKKEFMQILRDLGIFTGIALFIPSPWFILSFLATGSPIYPFLTGLYPLGSEYHGVAVGTFFRDVWLLFTTSPDPLSPLYLISLPLVVIALIKKSENVLRVASVYAGMAILIWYFLPRVGGGRFILPYLPVFSFLVVSALHELRDRGMQKMVRITVMGLIVFYSMFFIFYRFAANAKFIPYLTGRETKSEFLSSRLNFSYGDFYDTDHFFENTIKPDDNVLLIGFHNLYYVDFPFIDQSYVKKGDRFNYIAVQNAELPERFSAWNLVYTNPLTHVRVYSTGGMKWVY